MMDDVDSAVPTSADDGRRTRPAAPRGRTEGSAGAQERARGLLRRHRLFVWVLVVAALLRVLTWLGYRSALFFPDSFAYLKTALP